MRYPNFSFLLEGERGWIHSRAFFDAMKQLGMNVAEYHVAVGRVISPEEMSYYADAVLTALAARPYLRDVDTEAYEYVRYISRVLKSWGEKKYIVHVVEINE